MKIGIFTLLFAITLLLKINSSEINQLDNLEKKVATIKQVLEQVHNRLIKSSQNMKKVIVQSQKFERQIVMENIELKETVKKEDEDELPIEKTKPDMWQFWEQAMFESASMTNPFNEYFACILLQLELAKTEKEIYKIKYESKN